VFVPNPYFRAPVQIPTIHMSSSAATRLDLVDTYYCTTHSESKASQQFFNIIARREGTFRYLLCLLCLVDLIQFCEATPMLGCRNTPTE